MYLIHSYLYSSVSPENSSCGTSFVCAANVSWDSVFYSVIFSTSAFLSTGCSYALGNSSTSLLPTTVRSAGIRSLKVYRGALAQFFSMFFMVSSPGPVPETIEYLYCSSLSASKTGFYFSGNF